MHDWPIRLPASVAAPVDDRVMAEIEAAGPHSTAGAVVVGAAGAVAGAGTPETAFAVEGAMVAAVGFVAAELPAADVAAC